MLYKYVSLNSKSFESILKKQELYFASVKSMNDPFEGKPSFRFPSKAEVKSHLRQCGTKQKNINHLVRRAMVDLEHNLALIDQLNEAYVELTGLLCMTPVSDSLLMWAHYADSHNGVCFGFDVKRPFDPVFGVGYNVVYGDAYPEISLLDVDAVMAKESLASGAANEELEIRRCAAVFQGKMLGIRTRGPVCQAARSAWGWPAHVQ